MQQPSFQTQLDAGLAVLQSLAGQAQQIEQIAATVRDALLAGHMLLTCGNGGSATDAQHLAEELIGRYRANRRALPAVALTADSAALTCIANDFGYEASFERQLEMQAQPGDLLLCISSSGNSAKTGQRFRQRAGRRRSTTRPATAGNSFMCTTPARPRRSDICDYPSTFASGPCVSSARLIITRRKLAKSVATSMSRRR